MRALTALALIALTACATPRQSALDRFGVSHALATTGITLSSRWVLGSGAPGALVSCGFFLGKESQETQMWTEYWESPLESVADVIVPCAVGLIIHKLLPPSEG